MDEGQRHLVKRVALFSFRHMSPFIIFIGAICVLIAYAVIHWMWDDPDA